MTAFVQQYAVLRWSAVAAFVVAAVLVARRLAVPDHPAEPQRRNGIRSGITWSDPVILGGASVARPDRSSAHRESDAAHLLMCLVMLTMLVFPAAADPHALRGVLTAMTVVFVLLPLLGIAQHRNGFGDVLRHLGALGYHAVAAGAMLYAMSGHTAGDHAGPAVLPASLLAVLFCLDALAIAALPAARRRHLPTHPSEGASAVIPHVVMDLGTAYMLLAAVHG